MMHSDPQEPDEHEFQKFLGSQQNYKDNSKSKYTAAKHHQHLNRCFDCAVKWFYIILNSFSRIRAECATAEGER